MLWRTQTPAVQCTMAKFLTDATDVELQELFTTASPGDVRYRQNCMRRGFISSTDNYLVVLVKNGVFTDTRLDALFGLPLV
jgi:hypothetical protein